MSTCRATGSASHGTLVWFETAPVTTRLSPVSISGTISQRTGLCGSLMFTAPQGGTLLSAVRQADEPVGCVGADEVPQEGGLAGQGRQVAVPARGVGLERRDAVEVQPCGVEGRLVPQVAQLLVPSPLLMVESK